MDKQTVLLTGASSGIGLELAKRFAQEGYDLVLLARSREGLEQLAQALRESHGVRAEVLVADLRVPDAALAILQALGERQLVIDVVVNNAGFGLQGLHDQLDMRQQMDLLQVNIMALTQLTRLLLPGMRQRNVGGVLNVASVAAFVAGPGMAVYYASKAFVLSFTEALHEELSQTRLKVSCLCPGPTHTRFFTAGNMDGARLLALGAQSAQAVAHYGFAAFQRNQAIAVPGWKNLWMAHLTRLSPRFLARKIAQQFNQ